jgi:2,3-bisphosphoglycerate-dependent phosphoglycerate mutase
MAALAGFGAGNVAAVTTVVFETHSWSTDNERGIATGWLPGALSERGRTLAAELGVRRRDDGIAAVFSSDLERAAETTRIAFAGSSVPILLDWRLRECNYGEFNGAPAEQVAAERQARRSIPYPGGESWQQAVARVSEALADLRRWWPNDRVLVIGHVATRWALDQLVNGDCLETLIESDFGWREGWEYDLSA